MQNTIVMKWGLLMEGKIEWRGKNGRGKGEKRETCIIRGVKCLKSLLFLLNTNLLFC